jgi:thioredoxin 1
MLRIYYFTATWCGPCKVFGPILKDVVENMTDVELVKVDADENQDMVNKFGIKGFPTIIVTKDDKELSRSAGLMPKVKLQQFLASVGA